MASAKRLRRFLPMIGAWTAFVAVLVGIPLFANNPGAEQSPGGAALIPVRAKTKDAIQPSRALPPRPPDADDTEAYGEPPILFASPVVMNLAPLEEPDDIFDDDGPMGGPELAPPLTVNFQGTLDNNTSIPPDTMGAVGPSHVAEILNIGFQVFSRAGAPLTGLTSLTGFWSSLGAGGGQPANNPFDPKILYDQYSGRFVVITVSDDGINGWILVGISQTNNPTLGWNLYAIQVDVGVHAAHHPDYPGLGVDPNNVIVTANVFDGAGNFVHVDVWVISKAAMIAGPGPLTLGVHYSQFHDPCATVNAPFTPCHTFGQTAGTAENYILDEGWLDAGTRIIRSFRLKRITGTGAAAVLACAGGNDFVRVNNYNFNQLDAPQSGCATPIETNDTKLLNAVWRNGRVWTTQSVGIGTGLTDAAPPSRPEVAWYEINPATAGVFPGPFVAQQGRVSDASLSYYFPSIAVNADLCTALGFSGSSAATFANAYYTLRAPSDLPGTTLPESVLKAGLGTYRKQFGDTRNRWGDYSATMVDPVDDRAFWTVQEYALIQSGGGAVCVLDAGRWGTWWGQFRCCPGPACNDGNACTTNDMCVGGVCTGGAPPNCDDTNVCTSDSCDTVMGCVHTNLTGNACDDGDDCTVSDMCSAGMCDGTPIVILFADVAPPGGDDMIDINDILCVLDDFTDPANCSGNGDLIPCGGGGDGVDLNDILAELGAFNGIYACPHPCPP